MNGYTGKIAAWAAATLLAMSGVSEAVFAQAWKPSREITIVVGTGAGGGAVLASGKDAAALGWAGAAESRFTGSSPMTSPAPISASQRSARAASCGVMSF